MFIGRKKELESLEQLYETDKFEFAVIYGRRRVGKSTLIKEFCKDKKSIYYIGVEGGQKDNLAGFSASILSVVQPSLLQLTFQSYEQLFDYIDGIANEKIILAIDEYPYLAQGYEPLSSLIQKHIDENWKDSKLKLILCGSSMSFMENQVLGYKSPLYGRRTAQYKIERFKLHEIKEFHWNFTYEELTKIYVITGGIGEYLSFIDDHLSVKENIIKLYLHPQGRMFEEPTNLLKQELREPRIYHSVLNAIAHSKNTLNEIAQQIGDTTSSCSYYLNSLLSLDIIGKEIPIGEKSSTKKTTYYIKDSAFIFWYRFVYPYVSLIVQQNGEYVYNSFVEKNLNHYMGKVFERICMMYLLQPSVIENAPFAYAEVGRWWGGNPITKKQEEIDICAMNSHNILIGECKWHKDPIDMTVLSDLLKQGELFTQENKYYYLFSLSGYKENVLEYARDHDNLYLINLENIIECK